MVGLGGWQQKSVSGNYPEGFLPLKDVVEETVENVWITPETRWRSDEGGYGIESQSERSSSS